MFGITNWSLSMAIDIHTGSSGGTAQTLELAVKQHQAGNLREAERLYRQILQAEPRHADALHLLGVIAQQVGRNEVAIQHIRAALREKPNYAAAHANLGVALEALGQLDQAVASLRQAVSLKPDFAEAHNNLGKALRLQGKPAEAIASLQEAVRFRPDYFEAITSLGSALQEQGKFTEAAASYEQALRLQPHSAATHNALGCIRRMQGQLAEAAFSFQQAVHFKSDFAEAYNNLGGVLINQGKTAEAVANLERAVSLQPDYAVAHSNLGTARHQQGQLDKAVASYERAVAINPDYAEAYSNLGSVLVTQGKPAEAVANLERAVALKPDFAVAYSNLGTARLDQGQLEEARASFQQAMRLKPGDVAAHDNLVMMLNYHPGFDSAAVFQEAQRWNDQHAEPLAKFRLPHANSPDPDRRLRIGYVSPDFRMHAVSFTTMPLLSNHDLRQVEVFCYAQLTRPDDVTERLHACAGVWRVTDGLTDEQLADMVRTDRIDILVDLALHTANNRLLVFARKPAPVQVTWLGYPGTTGLSTMDYRLTDPYLDPPGTSDSCYSEQSIRLPDSFWCYDPLGDTKPVNDLPALTNGWITFGSLNRYSKFNDGVLLLWAKVLLAVPQSRLLLLGPRGPTRDHILAQLRKQGIDEQRVEFSDRRPRQQYLEVYNRIDLGLDHLPYNGHTTSLDAFWMGVPTITLIGQTVVGRAGLSQLCNLGLPELAAQTPDEYVALAAQLAGDLPRLQELRATMRVRMRASPLMDGERFARNVEQAFRQMWVTWCQGINAEGKQPQRNQF
jgi:protein O-GlcNAc transferase